MHKFSGNMPRSSHILKTKFQPYWFLYIILTGIRLYDEDLLLFFFFEFPINEKFAVVKGKIVNINQIVKANSKVSL